eukprot:Anaeramoba_flamelloidesc39654_g2_i2.p1 GENE.c39654_g2_i2~~c39654_g2_i2.p1  ORF type:complete len:172 (+),score=13.99 c39654_g2_i2:169-684(+)
MKLTVPNLVKQAQIVSKELIRVAILWNEIWYQAFEDTSRMYFRHGKINEMLRILGPLHKRLKKENKTRNEKIFLFSFFNRLCKGPRILNISLILPCRKYILEVSSNAWYHISFHKIATLINSFETICACLTKFGTVNFIFSIIFFASLVLFFFFVLIIIFKFLILEASITS